MVLLWEDLAASVGEAGDCDLGLGIEQLLHFCCALGRFAESENGRPPGALPDPADAAPPQPLDARFDGWTVVRTSLHRSE